MKLKQLQVPAICLGLAAAVFIVFGQVARHDFICVDDDFYVYRNPVVTRGLSWEGFIWAFTQAHAANWHPLTWLSHMLDCEFYGLQPGGHHVTNVLLHATNAVLLFLLLRKLLKATWQSALVAAVFAIHPLRVESVAWIAERKDVLSGLFFLLTLGAYVQYARAGSWTRYALTLVLFALGLMSKPMLVTLPFVLLLLDYWPLQRAHKIKWQTLLVEKLPFLALVAASCALTVWAQRQVGAIRTGEELSLPWRAANAGLSYLGYMAQMVFPTRLSPYYPHPGIHLPLWEIASAVLILTLITIGVVFWRRRLPYLPVGWFWYLGMLVPVIGLVQVGAQGHADRYTYLPQIGLCLIIILGLADLSQRWSRDAKTGLAVGAGICLLLLGASAWRQTQYWRNSEILWTRALQFHPNSSWIQKVVGDLLYDQGRFEEAIVHYQRGFEITPNYAGLRLNYGNALYRLSRLDAAQPHLEAARQLDPSMPDAYISLAVVLYMKGQIDPAVQLLETLLARDPDNPSALSNLGVARESQGRLDEAIECFRRALTVKPSLHNARSNLARVLLAQGRAAEAISHYEQATVTAPTDAALRAAYAHALAQAGQFERAIAELRQALALLRPEQQAEVRKWGERLQKYQAGQGE